MRWALVLMIAGCASGPQPAPPLRPYDEAVRDARACESATPGECAGYWTRVENERRVLETEQARSDRRRERWRRAGEAIGNAQPVNCTTTRWGDTSTTTCR